MKAIDGIELLKMIKNREIKADTEIKVWFNDDTLKEFVTTLYFNGIDLTWQPNTFYVRYFYDQYIEFEIIEEEKELEEIEIQENRKVRYMKDKFIESMFKHFYDMDLEVRQKLNDVIKEIKKIKKEGK